MLKKLLPGFILISISIFTGCASIYAIQADHVLNSAPEDVARGDPINNLLVKEYLHNVLLFPEEYEVKAYTRRAFSPKNRKSFLVFHMFYVYFKDGKPEHTLVFTATPKGSESNGSWMLNAPTDRESYNLYLESSNIWEVEEYQGTRGETVLDLIGTTHNIVERLEKGYSFFGPASVRNLPWYHLLWMTLIPPPFSPQMLILLSINRDNCTSSILETIQWL